MLLLPIGLPAVLAYAQARGSLPWAILARVAASFAVGAFLVAAAARILWTAVRG